VREPGERVVQLPWLRPSALSLTSLARSDGARAWDAIRIDPGAVALLMSATAGARNGPALSEPSHLAEEPAVFRAALCLLDTKPSGYVNWAQAPAKAIHRMALQFAGVAHDVASASGRSPPEAAWICGLLAPLGWLSVCAVDPHTVQDCLDDLELNQNPQAAQQHHWGFNQTALARRLCRRWGFPRWLEAIIGHLDLSAESAAVMGADLDLVRTVQLAVALVERHDPKRCLSVPGDPVCEHAPALGLSPGDIESIEKGLHGAGEWLPAAPTWQDPDQVPLLRDLLKLAWEHRKLAAGPDLRELERTVDKLHRQLQEQQTSEEARLRAQKLSALAELAAGAGHEINNPLAVISGQAQYLLNHEDEPAKQRSCQSIVQQAQRIHNLLNELMQFARPPRIQKETSDAAEVTRQAVQNTSDLAQQRQVQVIIEVPENGLPAYFDPKQIKSALTALVRNGIEAAPCQGWVRIRLATPHAERLEWWVEDSGTGPSSLQRDHLFDPFYSGRQAGRGRGLGLPTAWRLAREHGGELSYDWNRGGPTRFTLSIPRESTLAGDHSPVALMPTLHNGAEMRNGDSTDQERLAARDNGSELP
jgi:signal transduction histidine kinase